MLTHKGTLTLKTPRLILRRFTVNDAQMMYDNWAADENVPKYLSWKIHESVEQTKEILTQWVGEYDSPEYYHWAIQYIPDNMIVGGINLHGVSNKSWRSELGYNLGSKWWNKNIMTESAAAVLKFAFDEIGFNKVCAMHDTENIGSGRVMQKIGMIREGHFYKHSRRKDGTWGDIDYYSILKDNWEKINKK